MVHIEIKRILLFVMLGGVAVALGCTPNRELTRDQYRSDKRTYNASSDKEYVYTYNERDNSGSLYREKSKSGNQRDDFDSRRYGSKNGFSDDNQHSSPRKENFYQTGLASWYGREFHGRMTASGERFDMKEFTAAHRKLPFGTIILVKNLNNGKTAQVRINDRGPYRKKRILDVSYATAKRLEMLADGEAKVGITLLEKSKGGEVTDNYRNDAIEPVSGFKIKEYEGNGSNEAPAYSKREVGGHYSLQAGAFYSQKNAYALKKKIEKLLEKPVVVFKENDFYKVKVENVNSRTEAARYRRILRRQNIKAFVLEGKE